MALKVTLSFKESEKEMYDFLMSQLSHSIYLKSLIKPQMECEKAPEKQQSKNLLDF
jgi:hypothetical protein